MNSCLCNEEVVFPLAGNEVEIVFEESMYVVVS